MVHAVQAHQFYEQDYYMPSKMFEWELRVQAFQNSVIHVQQGWT